MPLSRRESLSTDALAAILIGDSVYNVVPNHWVDDDLARLRAPRRLRFLLAASKGAGGVGLVFRRRDPRVARLAAVCLVLYFFLALGAHARVRDDAWRYGSAAALLGWSGLTYVRLTRVRPAAAVR